MRVKLKSSSIIGLLVICLLSINAYAENTLAAQAKQAIERAEAARMEAAMAKGEWRDTAKIIDQATTAAAAGDYSKAIELANRARRQGELGYKQAISQRNADFPSYF